MPRASPRSQDLAALLNKMGARIEGGGTSTIHVVGVDRLHGAEHTIIADRIEAGTFLIAGAMTHGNVVISGCVPEHLDALVSKLRQAGAEVTQVRPGCSARSRSNGRWRATDITTEEYPGFATDLQAQYLAMMTLAEGISFVTETIFENRFMHTQELARMGANIRVEGRQAIVAGVGELTGAQVLASDLRASASLVLAGLVAKGETIIDRVYHIDRGYEKIEEKLARAGASHRARELNMAAPKHHNPGFLALVNDARSRVREIDIEGYQRMRGIRRAARAGGYPRGERMGRRARRRAPCTWGRESSSATSRPRCRTKTRPWCCTAAADSARCCRPRRWARWGTATSFRSTADGGIIRSSGLPVEK